MGFKCGIVGLPNVGKSTLFSALSGVQAEAANYPFCTIEPNVALVEVPDLRLKKLAELVPTQKVIPTVVEFVDIAGLVRGAHKGEGLGNQFLSHIRSVDALVQVIRCFEDSNIIHVSGRVDPIDDLETIQTELALADLQVAEKRLSTIEKKAKTGDKEAKLQGEAVAKAMTHLAAGQSLRTLKLSDDEKSLLKDLNFLTLKPQIFVANVGEREVGAANPHVARVRERAAKEHIEVVEISAQIESEVASLPPEERAGFLNELGIAERGLDRLIRSGYQMLGLRTFFTVGPKEIRAWTIEAGHTAPQAAGKIHSDFEKGFIRSETFHYDDLVALKSEKGIRESGKLRLEGKDYLVQDGDIMHFLFQV